MSETAKPHWSARPALIAALAFLALGLIAMAWTPYATERPDVASALLGPSLQHLLGTDALGRDVLSLLMKAVTTSLAISGVALVAAALIGVPIGLATAAWGRSAQGLIIKGAETLFVFPVLVVAVLAAATLGPGPVPLVIAIGIATIPAFVRAAFQAALALRRTDYAEAGRLAGLSAIESWRKYVRPELTAVIIATALTQLPVAVLAEAALSYVGLGMQPPSSSFGLILRDAQTQMLRPLPMIVPGLVLTLLALALALTALGYRKRLDPRLARIRGADAAA